MQVETPEKVTQAATNRDTTEKHGVCLEAPTQQLTNEMQETTVVRDELYVLSFENTKTCDILPEIERQTLSSNSGQIMSENGNKEDNDGFTVVSYKKQHVNTKGNGQKKEIQG
jgi:hypothetical protein